jgi:hypothetical protein
MVTGLAVCFRVDSSLLNEKRVQDGVIAKKKYQCLTARLVQFYSNSRSDGTASVGWVWMHARANFDGELLLASRS